MTAEWRPQRQAPLPLPRPPACRSLPKPRAPLPPSLPLRQRRRRSQQLPPSPLPPPEAAQPAAGACADGSGSLALSSAQRSACTAALRAQHAQQRWLPQRRLQQPRRNSRVGRHSRAPPHPDQQDAARPTYKLASPFHPAESVAYTQHSTALPSHIFPFMLAACGAPLRAPLAQGAEKSAKQSRAKGGLPWRATLHCRLPLRCRHFFFAICALHSALV